MFSSFYGARDYVAAFCAVLLVALGVLSYFKINVPYLDMIVAAIFILGGVFAFLDAFDVDSMGMRVTYMILFLVVIFLGVNVFVSIPYLSGAIAAVPISITHYIINGIVALALLFVAFQST